MSEQLAYMPPKSVSFGHDARVRDSKAAWALTEKFLAENTVASLKKNISFECWAPNEWTEAEPANISLAAARDSFGKEIDDSHTVRQWALESQQLPKALELFFAAEQWTKQQMGPIILRIYYDFTWRSFDNDSVRKSNLGITFNCQKLFLQPFFYFPFAWDTREHMEWLEQIMTSSPFRFRDQYFKRTIPTKDGKSYRTVKLAKDWRTTN